MKPEVFIGAGIGLLIGYLIFLIRSPRYMLLLQVKRIKLELRRLWLTWN